MSAVRDGFTDERRLHIGRNGNIENLNRLIGKQFTSVGIAARDTVCLRDRLSPSGIACNDRDRVEAGLAVGHEMAVAHDEAGTDATDANIPPPGPSRQVVQG
jgi:hypothetical protein